VLTVIHFEEWVFLILVHFLVPVSLVTLGIRLNIASNELLDFGVEGGCSGNAETPISIVILIVPLSIGVLLFVLVVAMWIFGLGIVRLHVIIVIVVIVGEFVKGKAECSRACRGLRFTLDAVR